MYTRSFLPRLPDLPAFSGLSGLPCASRPAAPSGRASVASVPDGASPPGRTSFSPLAALPFLSFFLCFFRLRSGSGLPQ